jgi:hypothetical protein
MILISSMRYLFSASVVPEQASRFVQTRCKRESATRERMHSRERQARKDPPEKPARQCRFFKRSA